jgi:uncharacterized protein YgiM (DUF1202 family)
LEVCKPQHLSSQERSHQLRKELTGSFQDQPDFKMTSDQADDGLVKKSKELHGKQVNVVAQSMGTGARSSGKQASSSSLQLSNFKHETLGPSLLKSCNS